jgi:hypothetical protein
MNAKKTIAEINTPFEDFISRSFPMPGTEAATLNPHTLHDSAGKPKRQLSLGTA